jgi:hypothetical protein
MYELLWYDNAKSKSSLNDYVLFKNQIKMEHYLLDNLDFYGVSLKFKARSNTLPLNGRVHSWNEGMDDKCPLCNNGKEDLRHFFTCCKLNNIRSNEYMQLECKLLGQNLEIFCHLFIAGDLDLMLGTPWDQDELGNCFDLFCKSYLKRAWSLRSSILKESN